MESRDTDKSSLAYCLAINAIPRLGNHQRATWVLNYGSQWLFKQTEQQLIELGLTPNQRKAVLSPNWTRIDTIINSIPDDCFTITIEDERYSDLLKQIYDPPIVLFARGNAALLKQNSIAMVGSRMASYTARQNANAIACKLSEQHITVVSGLALGVDGAAHAGALGGQGKTIAVIATGIDRCYPKRHHQLAKEIIAKDGLIITEFLPGVSPKQGHFPRRNRIISGLSLGTVIVEAKLQSGTLVTARLAIEQDREVFAIPGSIDNPNAKGCHMLIKQGAKLIDCADDIVEELSLFSNQAGHLDTADAMPHQTVATQKTEKNEQQDLFLDPLLASVDFETTPIDAVVSRSKLPTDEVLTRLTMLELKGLVSAVPGGYLRLNRG